MRDRWWRDAVLYQISPSSFAVAVNLGSKPVEVAMDGGTVTICTNRERDGGAVTGSLALAPAEGVIVSIEAAS